MTHTSTRTTISVKSLGPQPASVIRSRVFQALHAGTRLGSGQISVLLTADYLGHLDTDKAWKEYEAQLPSWSNSGKQIIVPGTSHYLHHYRPDAVVKEILALSVQKTSER